MVLKMKSHALIMPKLQFDIKVDGADQTLTMKFTRDKKLIAGYRKLREDLYQIDPRFVGFRIFSEDDAENYEDPNDQMLIVHDEDGRCLGGACLRVSTPERLVILDLEHDILWLGKGFFSLRANLPEMALDKYSYAEFNRIVVDPSLRKGDIARQIFRAVLERCIKYRVRYITGIGDKVRIRLYKQIYNTLGLDCVVPTDLDIPMRPEYEGKKLYLICFDTKKFHITPQDPNATALLSPRSDFQFD